MLDSSLLADEAKTNLLNENTKEYDGIAQEGKLPQHIVIRN